MKLVRLFSANKLCRTHVRNYLVTSSPNPKDLLLSDVGKLYAVPEDAQKILNFPAILPTIYTKQNDTLKELVWMCREPLLEGINCFRAIRTNFPALRLVLWGPFGTGKTTTQLQILHYAHTQNMVILHVPDVMKWARTFNNEIQQSNFNESLINTPLQAVDILALFKHQNQLIWEKLAELKTERKYLWSKMEKTEEGKPLTDVIDLGLSAPFLATDCVGALCRELRRHASAGAIKLIVSLGNANSLYGRKTTIRKPDKAMPEELSLVHNFRKFLKNDWSNGICVMVADKAEYSDPGDSNTIPRNTPLELFGEEGFEAIDPFIPLETKLYSKKEADAIYDYYKEKNWLTGEKARSEEGQKQLYYLSAHNPYYYERLCAFN